MKDALLFVYGTLLCDDNEFAIYLKNNSSFYAEGKVKGILYDIGEYPGTVLARNAENYIYGTILQLDDPKKVLPVIDDYEGFGEDQPQPNEFVRIQTEVQMETTTLPCWIYIYNWSIAGLSQIVSGKYVR